MFDPFETFASDLFNAQRLLCNVLLFVFLILFLFDTQSSNRNTNMNKNMNKNRIPPFPALPVPLSVVLWSRGPAAPVGR